MAKIKYFNEQTQKWERANEAEGVTKDYVRENFIEAVDENVEGEVIAVNDVSELGHNVEVKASSKNLFGEENFGVHDNSRYVIVDGVSYYKFKDDDTSLIIQNCFVPNKQYVFSINAYRTTNNAIVFRITYTDDTFEDKSIQNSSFNTNVLIISKKNKSIQKISFSYAYAEDVYINLEKTQLEKGTTSTPYTPYLSDTEISQSNLLVCKNEADLPNAKSYPIGENLTVNLDSISPEMYIKADKAGILLNTTYNADTKKWVLSQIEKASATPTTLEL